MNWRAYAWITKHLKGELITSISIVPTTLRHNSFLVPMATNIIILFFASILIGKYFARQCKFVFGKFDTYCSRGRRDFVQTHGAPEGNMQGTTLAQAVK